MDGLNRPPGRGVRCRRIDEIVGLGWSFVEGFEQQWLTLIGTMNTAFRSLALVDYALRRRFAFFNLTPQFNAKFRAHLDAQDVPEDVASRIIDRLNALNEAIRVDKNLGWGFDVGHSYFCNSSGEEA